MSGFAPAYISVRYVLSKGRIVQVTSILFVRGHIGQGLSDIASKEGFTYPGSSVTLSFSSYNNLKALITRNYTENLYFCEKSSSFKPFELDILNLVKLSI